MYTIILRIKESYCKPTFEKIPDQIRLSDWNIKMKDGKPVLTKAGNTINIGTVEKKNWLKNNNDRNPLINEYIATRIEAIELAFKNHKKVSATPFVETQLSFHDFIKNEIAAIENGSSRLSYKTVYDSFKKVFPESSKLPTNALFIYAHTLILKKLATCTIRLRVFFIRKCMEGYSQKTGKEFELNIKSLNKEIREKDSTQVRTKMNKKRKKRVDYSNITTIITYFSQLEIPPLIDETAKRKLVRWSSIGTFLLCFFCRGMRVRDAILLKWENIEEDKIIYAPSKTERYAKIIHIPITQQIAKILALLKQQRKDEYVFPWHYLSYVQYSGDDEDVYEKSIRAIIRKINDRLKIMSKKIEIQADLTSHSARHSFITHIYQSTGDVYKASRAAGHASVSMTERYVEDLSAEEIKETMERLFN